MLTKRTLLAALYTCKLLLTPKISTTKVKSCDKFINKLNIRQPTTEHIQIIAKNSNCNKGFMDIFRAKFQVPLSETQTHHFQEIGGFCYLLRRVPNKMIRIQHLPIVLLYATEIIYKDAALWAWTLPSSGKRWKTSGPVALIKEEDISNVFDSFGNESAENTSVNPDIVVSEGFETAIEDSLNEAKVVTNIINKEEDNISSSGNVRTATKTSDDSL